MENHDAKELKAWIRKKEQQIKHNKWGHPGKLRIGNKGNIEGIKSTQWR